jgi:hypothetical protein
VVQPSGNSSRASPSLKDGRTIISSPGVREVLVARVDAYLTQVGSEADATDVAHVVLALVQGLALQESAGWLGTSRASVDRRWHLAVDTLLDGLATHVGDARAPRSGGRRRRRSGR